MFKRKNSTKMANVTNIDLLNKLKTIESSFDDKVTRLNKYYIGRLVHFERQLNSVLEESEYCKKELNTLNLKYGHACNEIKELKDELTTLKNVGVSLPVNSSEHEINTNDIGCVSDTNVINTTLNNIFKQHGVSNDLITVKSDLNTMKQNNMLNDVVITGIPEDKNENLLATVNNVLMNYNLEIKSADIKSIYRLKNSKCGVNSPILLQLRNEDIKISILEKQKLNGPVVLNSKEKNISLKDFQSVYFKHRLTSENLSLLRAVQKFGRENNYAFIWTTHDGKILMRKNSNERAIKISSLRDLEIL